MLLHEIVARSARGRQRDSRVVSRLRRADGAIINEGHPRRETDAGVVAWLKAAYDRPDAKDLYLHGSDMAFERFHQPKLEYGHLIFFSKLVDWNESNDRVLQAEYYGHHLYLAKLHNRHAFNPLNDPKAHAIFDEALTNDIKGVQWKQWDYETKMQWGRLDYQDLHLVVPQAVAAGYNFFTVYEVSMRGNSYAVTDPAMVEIVARYP